MWNSIKDMGPDHLLAGLLIISISVSGAMAGAVSAGYHVPTEPLGLRWGPFITGTDSSSATISWRAGEECNYSVLYANDTTYSDRLGYDRRVPGTRQGEMYRAVLDDLEAGMTYHYRITCGNNSTQDWHFRTFPLSGPVRFVVYGDTREQLPDWNQSTHHALVADRIAADQEILFVIHTGDLVNNPRDINEWDRFFSAAGPMLANTTFFPVAGNHEHDFATYQEIFGVPPWYSFTSSDIRIIVLDSNPLPPLREEEQKLWLIEELDNRENWTFFVLHHPPYSADEKHPGGFVNVRTSWEEAFQRAGTSAAFSGHVHAYEHYEVARIHYFTIATGGAPSYPLSRQKQEGYRNDLENTLGYARVSVNTLSDHGIIEFIRVGEVNGSEIKPFSPGNVFERVVIDKKPDAVTLSLFPGFPGNIPISPFKREIKTISSRIDQ